MYFTGFTRFSSDMQKANQAGYDEKIKQLQQMYALVDEAERVLEDKHCDLDDFGRLLDTTWRLKRQTGGAITTNSIDALYEKGIQAGALGGKLLGVAVVASDIYVQPRKNCCHGSIMNYLYVPFRFEDGGTRVIHFTLRCLKREEQ
jgi:D-glycero-alpha-D-manno-heptose-7-phosphate kinase